MKIIALLGSLRAGSFNRMLLNAAIELAPEGVQIDIATISDIPLYNNDVEEREMPPSVTRLKDQIRQADAVLFVSPEYNYSVPGLLKNAIDWASRPPAQNPFHGKACAIMSASTGLFGGARMQYHLRQICVFLNLYPLNKPELMVTRATEKFDSNGRLTDDVAKRMIVEQLNALQSWSELLRGATKL